jgi:protein-disulfide isomerase
MTGNPEKRSPLPWIILLVFLAACFLCAMCAAGATGVYFLSRPASSSSTVKPGPPSTSLIATATASTESKPTESEPTSSPTAEPSTDPDTWRTAGDANALVVVEEFADFQCPFCGDFHARGEPQLWKEYIQTGKVRFIFRNYPVLDGGNSDGESHLAALGALCAGEQGKFWEYHDYLFENQPAENSGGFTTQHLLEFAVGLDLNRSSFDECLQSRRYEKTLSDDVRLGEDRGLEGVPTFFIQGQTLLGYDEKEFFGRIDRALNGSSFPSAV